MNGCLICLPNPLFPDLNWIFTTGMNIVLALMLLVVFILVAMQQIKKRRGRYDN
jgi:hypothetical protein